MSAYSNDPRIRPHPGFDGWWLVSINTASQPYLCMNSEITVCRGDDGLYSAFDDPPGVGFGQRLGTQLPHIPVGSFDSVVRALIGEPRS